MLLGDFNAACSTLVSTLLTVSCVCGSVVAVSCHVVRLLCPLSLCLPSGVASVGFRNSATFGKGSPRYFTICGSLGCACVPEILQNFSERPILWSLCSVVFHALTLKLPIQSPLSVAPKLPVSLSSNEKCPNFRKTSTPLVSVNPRKKTNKK